MPEPIDPRRLLEMMGLLPKQSTDPNVLSPDSDQPIEQASPRQTVVVPPAPVVIQQAPQEKGPMPMPGITGLPTNIPQLPQPIQAVADSQGEQRPADSMLKPGFGAPTTAPSGQSAGQPAPMASAPKKIEMEPDDLSGPAPSQLQHDAPPHAVHGDPNVIGPASDFRRDPDTGRLIGPPDGVDGPVLHPTPMQPPKTDAERTKDLSDQILKTIAGPTYSSIDPRTGQPATSLEPQDLVFASVASSDKWIQQKMAALDAKAAVDREEARQSAPNIQKYSADVQRITTQRDADAQTMIEHVKTGYDKARQAVDEANSLYPNPDDLLGGKGSWSRAIALSVAAAYAGQPGSTISSIVNQQMQLEMAGKNARYGQKLDYAKGLADTAESEGKSIPQVVAGYTSKLMAARERLASELAVVANGLADPKIAGALMDQKADFHKMNADQQIKIAKDYAEIELKGAEAEEHLASAAKKRGGTGGGPGPKTTPEVLWDDIPLKDREYYWSPDGTHAIRFPNKLSFEERAKLDSHQQTFTSASRMIQFIKNTGLKGEDLTKWLMSPAGGWFRSYAKSIVASEASTIGGKGIRMMEYLAGDIDKSAVGVFNPEGLIGELEGVEEVSQTRLNTILKGAGVTKNPYAKLQAAPPNAPPPDWDQLATNLVPDFNPSVSYASSMTPNGLQYPQSKQSVSLLNRGDDLVKTGTWDEGEHVTQLLNLRKRAEDERDKAEQALRGANDLLKKDPKNQKALQIVSNSTNAYLMYTTSISTLNSLIGQRTGSNLLKSDPARYQSPDDNKPNPKNRDRMPVRR